MMLVPLVAARHKEYDMDEARFENEALSLMEKFAGGGFLDPTPATYKSSDLPH